MNEHDKKNVFELTKYNELERLQGKVEYLRNEIDMLKREKANATHHILISGADERRDGIHKPWNRMVR